MYFDFMPVRKGLRDVRVGWGGAQVYAASVMFGYFVRRVDKRFHLERSLGLLPEAAEDAVKRLERLFAQACGQSTLELFPAAGRCLVCALCCAGSAWRRF